MPFDLLRGSRVEDEPDGELVVVPHAACRVVSVTKLICEAIAFIVEQQTAYTAQSLGAVQDKVLTVSKMLLRTTDETVKRTPRTLFWRLGH